MTNYTSKIKRELQRVYKQVFSPKLTLARLATRYLNFYNGFSYDFEKNGEKDLVRKLSKLDLETIFDVGSNVGEWSQIALEFFPRAKIHM